MVLQIPLHFLYPGDYLKNILIATPCLYGKVDAYYVHSLCESIKLGLQQEMLLKAIFLANESILPMARNELINLAHTEGYDATVFIDDDEYWNAEDLVNIIKSPKDVVCLPVVNKTDSVRVYNVNLPKQVDKDTTDGYVKAESVGTGFLKLSRKVVKELYDSSPEILFRNKKIRTIFEYSQQAGAFIGEDINLSSKIKELGYDIWVDPKATVSHLGTKMYKGNFNQDILK